MARNRWSFFYRRWWWILLFLSKYILSWFRGNWRWREIGGLFFIRRWWIDNRKKNIVTFRFFEIYCHGLMENEDGAKLVEFFKEDDELIKIGKKNNYYASKYVFVVWWRMKMARNRWDLFYKKYCSISLFRKRVKKMMNRLEELSEEYY